MNKKTKEKEPTREQITNTLIAATEMLVKINSNEPPDESPDEKLKRLKQLQEWQERLLQLQNRKKI